MRVTNGVKKPKAKKTTKKAPLQRQNAFVFKPMFKPELKSHSTEGQQIITNTTVSSFHVNLLNFVPAGQDAITRIGRKINVKSVHLSIWLTVPSPPVVTDILNIALVHDREAGVLPALGDIWSNSAVGGTPTTVYTGKNLNTKRFKILQRKLVPVTINQTGLIQANQDNVFWEWHRDFGPNGLDVVYNNATGGIAEMDGNALLLTYWGQNVVAGTVQINFSSRIRFYDA